MDLSKHLTDSEVFDTGWTREVSTATSRFEDAMRGDRETRCGGESRGDREVRIQIPIDIKRLEFNAAAPKFEVHILASSSDHKRGSFKKGAAINYACGVSEVASLQNPTPKDSI